MNVKATVFCQDDHENYSGTGENGTFRVLNQNEVSYRIHIPTLLLTGNLKQHVFLSRCREHIVIRNFVD